jgi:hypothetical protein
MPDEGRSPRADDGRDAGNHSRRTRLLFSRLQHRFTMQMIQRLKDLLAHTPGAVLDDWFELEARGYTYVVTFDTALHVKLAVERFPQPELVEFTDLFGAKHHVRPQDVVRIAESKRASSDFVR